jgi:anaerobic dimethyl sulfoxide reductase subunit C (anchor subunit)
MLKEWPLVAFTIAGQMAVGVFLLCGVPLALSVVFPASAGPPPDAATHGLRIAVLAVVLGLLIAAALLSFFHLHHPFRARRVLTNLRTSWLSREIFFELGFMALVALGAFLTWRRPTGVGLLTAVLITAGFAGVLFLVSMSKLYMLQTVPSWNQAHTPFSFVMAALILGAMASALLVDVLVGGRLYFGYLLNLSGFLVAAEIVISLLLAPGHGVFGPRTGPSLRPRARIPPLLHFGRLALLTAGFVLIWAAMTSRYDRAATGSGANGLLAAAFVLVLAGEVAGRFLFYGLLTRPGR